ncbi:MAG: hypothetical protein HC887_00395 [Desulfobacteraceae bacterium]|nr:hypothetical protein [Desulfobacteraceae bacterium]
MRYVIEGEILTPDKRTGNPFCLVYRNRIGHTLFCNRISVVKEDKHDL